MKTNPLEGTDGQLMVIAAHRYCLGRQSYIVGSCVEWLRAWWGDCDRTTRHVIMRDTIEALQDGNAGGSMDIREWKWFAEWAWDHMDDAGRRWVKQAVAHREKPWPLKDVDNRDGAYDSDAMNEKIKNLRDKLEAARVDLLGIIKDSTPDEIDKDKAAIAFIFGGLALSTIKDLLGAMCDDSDAEKWLARKRQEAAKKDAEFWANSPKVSLPHGKLAP